MTRVILITGGTGAGKTTHAMRIADEMGGVRFSIDDWMGTLFWMDTPQPFDIDWTLARITRCEAQIRATAAVLVARGVPVVLDLGFTAAAHRTAFADWARASGATPEIHWLDIPADRRWARVEQRNAAHGATFVMPVDRALFDFMEQRWEAPGMAERAATTTRIFDSE